MRSRIKNIEPPLAAFIPHGCFLSRNKPDSRRRSHSQYLGWLWRRSSFAHAEAGVYLCSPPDRGGPFARPAAGRILESVKGLTRDDLVLCLVSGGASALLALAAPGLTLADKQQVNLSLLKCGAAISEMNCVRKHLSAIKGGRLAAAAYPARV